MPRLPKNFQIDFVEIEQLEPRGYLPAGQDSAVPVHFQANFQLGAPPASVKIRVVVGAEGPAIQQLTIGTNVRTPITTSVLRQVLVDHLLREAMNAALVPGSVREEWLDTFPPGVLPERRKVVAPAPPKEERLRNLADQDAQTAAQIYSEAAAAGSKAPAVAVAQAMNRSRAQVARYIRRARELGLLPPLGSSEGA